MIWLGLCHWLRCGLCVQKTAFHRSQTLGYKNGFILPRRPSVVIGKEVLASEPLTHHDIDKLCFEGPYTVYDKPQYEEFIPAHVALDKKVWDHKEKYRYRLACTFLVLIPLTCIPCFRFFASMDTSWRKSWTPLQKITVFAPWPFTTTLRMTACASSSHQWRTLGYHKASVSNVSVCQKMSMGIITTGKISTLLWTWRSMGPSTASQTVICSLRYGNYLLCLPHTKRCRGIYRSTFGNIHTLCLCLTSSEQEFMESEGIILKEPEKKPEDPYTKHRSIKPILEHVNTSPAKFEKLYRFLHMDSKVNSGQMGGSF